MRVIPFHNEVRLLTDLSKDTVILIHHTSVVQAIKRLVDAHEILDMALVIEREHSDFSYQPPWDKALSKDLDLIRSELLTRFTEAFKPATLLPHYYQKVGRLLTTMELRI